MNVSHRHQARSPIFADGKFEFVSFPDHTNQTRYPAAVRSFVRRGIRTTHLDPDWENLTYGDCCQNPRAKALLSVETDDILLFWGLLWRIDDRRSDIWGCRHRGWYLLGALRVKLALNSGESLQCLKR